MDRHPRMEIGSKATLCSEMGRARRDHQSGGVAFQALGQAAGSLEDTEKAGGDGRTRRVVAFRH